MTMDCVEKIIKKDWIHPLTDEKLTEKDIIPLQRVGFAVNLNCICSFECLLLIIIIMLIGRNWVCQHQ